ncbi:MAG: SpoVR family protein [Armatimonadetes bacterium]|nr:SpoVR family protein [Armatimonadota bacterium]
MIDINVDPEITELSRAIEKIWEIGEGFGLDPFPTHFEIVPTSILYEFGAYALPGRFSHWTHGKAYHQMKTMYDYGLSKIYELVINTNPCYGFLLESNSLLQNKLVVAHVMGHCDFFKNNIWFGHTNRQMLDAVKHNAERIDRYTFNHGFQIVEEFLDAALAIQEHIDPYIRLQKKGSHHLSEAVLQGPLEGPYDDLWRLEHPKEELIKAEMKGKKFPPQPEKDLLGFIAQYAPDLEEWQRDILWIVRSEMLYFYPQMQTKIMNEGWASYWHAQILHELDLTDQEFVEFAELNSGVVSPGSRRSLNPYYVGLMIWKDLIKRWDNPTQEEREKQGREPGKGMEKAFEVRELENDVSFLRNYLTPKLVEELDLYTYRKEGDQWIIVEKDWEKVRDALVGQMTNMGFPVIMVEESDYRRNSELYLRHAYEGKELDLNYARHTLKYVQILWGRPVHLETVVDEQKVLLTHNGEMDSINKMD